MDGIENDISLKDLAFIEDLSIRSINICNNSDLTSLNRIMDFYKKKKSFMTIRNCGSKTENELIELCEKYAKQASIEKIGVKHKSINTIEALDSIQKVTLNKQIEYLISTLSPRTHNGLSNISQQLNPKVIFEKMFIEEIDFNDIRNIGSKSFEELIKFKSDVYNIAMALLANKKEQSPIQKVTLYRHIEYLISTLSVRTQNGLQSISENLVPKEIFDKIFVDGLVFNNIRNIGEKSIEELDKFRNDIYNFVMMLQTSSSELLIYEHTKLIIKSNFSALPVDFDKQIESTFDVNGKMKLFRLIDLLLDSEHFINKNENKVFRFVFSNYSAKKESLDSIAVDLNLSRERVRQIKIRLEKNIQNYFLFISNFISDDLVNYGIDKTKSLQVIDNTTANKINEYEKVNFNPAFYSIIFGIFLNKSHSILGDNEIISGERKTVNKKAYTCCYLIANNIFSHFDFARFSEDVNTKTTEKITESYSLNFEGYLCEFMHENGIAFLDSIKIVCESILFNEFELFIDSHGYLEIERNTHKKLHEYCYEILEKFSNPMTIDEISIALKDKYPHKTNQAQSIRSTLINNRDLFVSFGRTSTYALRKWESEKENLKGGTIRDIVEDYLKLFNAPKHISEIIEHVLIYREDTNESSVLTNIKVEHSRFVFYSGDFVGLKNKVYPLDTINFKRVVGSHFRSIAFEKLNGWDLDKVIQYYVQKYGYKDIQVQFLIRKKVNNGTLKLTLENKLFV